MGVSAEWVEQFLTDGRVLCNFIMKWKNNDGRNAVLLDGATEPRGEDGGSAAHYCHVTRRVAHGSNVRHRCGT